MTERELRDEIIRYMKINPHTGSYMVANADNVEAFVNDEDRYYETEYFDSHLDELNWDAQTLYAHLNFFDSAMSYYQLDKFKDITTYEGFDYSDYFNDTFIDHVLNNWHDMINWGHIDSVWDEEVWDLFEELHNLKLG